MLAPARQVLAARIPQIPLVSSGGKAFGAGAVYAVARAVGVSTMWLGTSPGTSTGTSPGTSTSTSTCRCPVAAEGPCR